MPYILILPLVMVIAAVFSLAGVYLGLKWNVQLQRGENPTVELPNPLTAIQERRQEKETATLLDEYLNGVKEGK